jgi:hypothetical protein
MRRQSQAGDLKQQLTELLDEHFDNAENPHVTIYKISELLSVSEKKCSPYSNIGRRH